MSAEQITALQPFGEAALWIVCGTIVILALLKTIRTIALVRAKQKGVDV